MSEGDITRLNRMYKCPEKQDDVTYGEADDDNNDIEINNDAPEKCNLNDDEINFEAQDNVVERRR